MAKNGDNMKMRCQEYIEALEEEQKKIQVFKRELPLCLLLVTQAIESYRKELSEFSRIQSECSERTTSESEDRDGCTALFEEFMPIKSNEHESCERIEDDEAENNGDKKKSEWLRSVQLWNQSPDPQTKEDQTTTVVEVKGNGGAFQPFQKEKATESQPLKAFTPTPTASSSTADTGGNKREVEQQKQLQMNRKQRRCWSPELHRRFLHALQQLGGSHVATPKQIRDLMQVDGLTNDEVKSHLQKYRLHTRRPATPTVTNGGENPQQPPLMVMEGIWVPSRSSPSQPRSIQRCKPPTTSSSTHLQLPLS